MKTKVVRTHQEDLNEISQLSTLTLLLTYSQPTFYPSSTASLGPTSHATIDQLILKTNQPRGHYMSYLNTGSMNIKRKTGTK